MKSAVLVEERRQACDGAGYLAVIDLRHSANGPKSDLW